MDELIKQLRGCKDIEYCSDCPRMPNGLIEPCDIKEDAADAIERLTDEVDRKDKAIQGLLTQIERLQHEQQP